VAIAIAIFATRGLGDLVPRVNGWAMLGVVVATLAFQAFVAALVVTALDSLVPARRRLRRS
jgi:hypothetical protein